MRHSFASRQPNRIVRRCSALVGTGTRAVLRNGRFSSLCRYPYPCRLIATASRSTRDTAPEDNMGMGRRGVFLDLAGTLVEPLKPDRLDQITLIPGVVEAVARLSSAGFVCPVVT